MSKAINNKNAWEYQGTAAKLDVTETSTDTTAGRVTKVGDFGVGETVPSFPVDLNGITQGRFTAYNSIVTLNSPFSLGCAFIAPYNGNTGGQIAVDSGSGALASRNLINGVSGTWRYQWDSENLGNFQNVSGGTIASNSTLAGASLSPAKAGTWRNVSGGDILNNGYGLWELI